MHTQDPQDPQGEPRTTNTQHTQNINDWILQLTDKLPQHLKSAQADLKEHLRINLQQLFSQYQLVTREEFDIQKTVLLRTRQKLEALEQQLEGKGDTNHTEAHR